MTAPAAPRGWTTTPALAAAVAAGVALLGLGLVAGRADVALLGAPLVLAGAWAHRGRPSAEVTARLVADDGPVLAGDVAARLDVTVPGDVPLVHLRVAAPGHHDTEVVLAGGEDRAVPLRLRTVRTGPQETFRADLRAYGDGGAWDQAPTTVSGRRRLVLPGTRPLGRVPLPDRLRGLTGPHTSRRLGDGDELRDVHPFQPGDRTRRIDWRATARRSPDLATLHVRRTLAQAEATAVLVLDSRDDVGPDLRTWRGSTEPRVDEPTSLDLARNAAASVARALVDAGDRVGLDDLATRRRPLPPAGGRRHLRRLLHGLALAHPVGAPAVRVRPPQVPADAVVYLFTTVLDDEPVRLAREWRETGHRVVLVDVLPAVRPVAETHMHLAWRISSLERENRLAALGRLGVPVVRWAGPEREQARARLESVARSAGRAPQAGGARGGRR